MTTQCSSFLSVLGTVKAVPARRYRRDARWLSTTIAQVLLVGLIVPHPVQAMGRLLFFDEGYITRCKPESASGSFSASEARYTVRGVCYVFYSSNPVKDKYGPAPGSTFDKEKLEYTVKWEARGKYHSETTLAEETISVLKQARPDQPNYTTVGKINASLTCDRDPWRESGPKTCRLTYAGHDRALDPNVIQGLYPGDTAVPASSLIDAAQRAALEQQYQRSLALRKPRQPGKENLTVEKAGVDKAIAPASQAPQTTNAYANAPTILSPQGLVLKGRGTFKIAASKYLNGSHALVQLKWLNPPPNLQGERLDFYQYEVPMSQIAGPNGMAAPEIYLAPGTWELRVRINQPKASDWSQPVRFEYRHDLAARTVPNSRAQTEGRAQTAPAAAGASSSPAAPASPAPPAHLDKAPPASGSGGPQLMRPERP